MDLLQTIRYALVVRQTGSLSAAAEKLYIAQPNLSRSLRRLEEELGITLFVRKSTGVLPSAEGEEFLRKAEPLINDLDMLVASCKKKHLYSISVAAQPSLVYSNTLNDLSEENGNRIKIQTCTFPALVNLVADKSVDFSLVIIPDKSERSFCEHLLQKKLEFQPLHRCKPFLCCRADHPLIKPDKIPSIETLKKCNIYHYLEMGDFSPLPPLPIKYQESGIERSLYRMQTNPDLVVWGAQPYKDAYSHLNNIVVPLPDDFWGYVFGYIHRTASPLDPFSLEIIEQISQVITACSIT